jgi:putative integral membrane protein (TIGR02587 family)
MADLKTPAASSQHDAHSSARFAYDLLRACAGAILFSFPMLMTMEMWWLGFHMSATRLALYMLLNIPLLIVLSYYAGFEATDALTSDVSDALTAYAVGFTLSAVLLGIFGVIGPGMSLDEIVGKIALQAVPASIGAMLARDELGQKDKQEETRRSARYEGGLFLMAIGAIYLSSSLASTEEMLLISYMMSPWHAIALVALSLLLMHGLVRIVVRQGKSPLPANDAPFWPLFLRFTLVGYAVALIVSAYMLWTFGRIDDMPLAQSLEAIVVLGFPAALGAGAARLIL